MHQSPLELEKGDVTPLSLELRLTAAEMVNPDIGREEGLRRLQKRAATTSLSNLGMLLERFSQTGGDRFHASFETASQNVQGILDARQKARAKAAEQIQSARIIPLLLAVTLFFFMNDPGFRTSFETPLVQMALAGAVLIMFVGYSIMTDIAKEAVWSFDHSTINWTNRLIGWIMCANSSNRLNFLHTDGSENG
jgi:hypothetical protein